MKCFLVRLSLRLWLDTSCIIALGTVGMKVIKQYAWEPSFEARVLGVRSEELQWLKKIAYTSSFNLTLIRLNPVILAGT